MRAFDPLDPDAPTARDWARDELTKAEYNDLGESWLVRFINWIGDLLDSLGTPRVGGGSLSFVNILIILGVIAAVVGVAWWVMGPLRRSRQSRRAHSVFDDDERRSEAMRDDAQRSASRGDWSAAVLDMYRSIIRSLEERDILDDRPGMTAFEAAVDAGAAFPSASRDLRVDAEVFDAIRYGHAHGTEENYRHVRATARLVSGSAVTVEVTP